MGLTSYIYGIPRNKWYLSHSGCGIKSGIHTTFWRWRAVVARPCVFVRAESMPKAAKRGLGKSHLSDLVQCTLNGSAQRPSPEEHRARPAATVPAQANRRKKRRSRQPRGRRLLRALRAGTNRPPPNSHPSTHGRDAPGDAIDRGHTQGAGWGRGWAGGREVGEMGSRDPGAQWCAKTSSSQSGCLGIY